jgi:hypothetical protein
MMGTTMRADPGIGREDAPVGSVEWAQRVRLTLQGVIKDLPEAPTRAKRYFDLIQKHRAWALMNKPDGSTFTTIDEFCAHPQPWGLGRSWDEIRPFMEAAMGKRSTQLATVAPAKSPPGKAGGDNYPKDKNPPAHASRLRAIAERTPEPARELFREGLIGAKEAAKLGPKNPTPEVAARVTEIAIKAADVAKAAKPKTPKEKRATQQKVNAVVRAELGDKGADPVIVAARALAAVPSYRLAELVKRLSPEVRSMLAMCIKDVS